MPVASITTTPALEPLPPQVVSTLPDLLRNQDASSAAAAAPIAPLV